METNAVDQLSALANPQRLALFRLLVRRYPDAVPAGEIAESLGARANTASSYLATLRQAGLIDQTRAGTSILYRADMDRMRGLITFLTEDCCRNRPDLCLTEKEMTPMTQTGRPLNVLFICTGNSARSIMAEAILNHEGAGRFRAASAGTRPAGAPHPKVLSLLQAKGHDVSGLRSKSLDDFAGPDADPLDFVFTVCDHAANEECPAWPGQPMSAHWGQPDPVRAEGTEAERELAFQQAYGILLNRLRAFASLPFDTLSKMSLQHRLDDIGRSGA